jgi:hypothetical protein
MTALQGGFEAMLGLEKAVPPTGFRLQTRERPSSGRLQMAVRTV